MAGSTGGSFLPNLSYSRTGATDTGGTYASPTITSPAITGTTTIAAGATLTSPALTTPTLTNPTINTTAFGTGQAPALWEKVALSGAAIHAGTVAIKAFSAASVILRVLVDITAASTGASTLDVGYTAASVSTSSDTLLDGVSGTPAALFDSMNAALDTGANALAQRAASGKWITITEASGDATGLVGNAYIEYILI